MKCKKNHSHSKKIIVADPDLEQKKLGSGSGFQKDWKPDQDSFYEFVLSLSNLYQYCNRPRLNLSMVT